MPRTPLIVITVICLVGALTGFGIGVFGGPAGEPANAGGTGKGQNGTEGGSAGETENGGGGGDLSVCEVPPGEDVQSVLPDAVPLEMPPAGIVTRCRWTALLESTPERRVTRQLTVGVRWPDDVAEDMREWREAETGSDGTQVTDEPTLGDDAFKVLTEPVGEAAMNFDASGEVTFVFVHSGVEVDVALSGWEWDPTVAREGLERRVADPAEMEADALRLAKVVRERMPELVDQLRRPPDEPAAEHTVKQIPDKACDLLAGEVIGAMVAADAEPYELDLEDEIACAVSSPFRPRERKDGATLWGIDVGVERFEDADHAANAMTAGIGGAIERNFDQAHYAVDLPDLGDSGRLVVGSRTFAEEESTTGVLIAAVRRGDVVVELHMRGRHWGPQGEEAMPAEDLEAAAVTVMEEVLAQL